MLGYFLGYIGIGAAVVLLHPTLRGHLKEFWSCDSEGSDVIVKPILGLFVAVVACLIWPLALFNAMREKPDPPESTLGKAQRLAGMLVVGGYRRVFAQGQVGASPDMPDEIIFQIYQQVGTAFQDVARERGEHLEAGVINMIVLLFIENFRTQGEEFCKSHLRYELDKYRQEGLREDYKTPLNFF